MTKWKRIEGGGGDDFSDEKTWIPEEMPELEGTLLENKNNVGVFKSSLWKLQTPEEVVYTVWSSTVLTSLLGKVPMGSYVKIVYLGKKKNKKGHSQYKDFQLFVSEDTEIKQDAVIDTNKKSEVTTKAVVNDDEYDEVPF
tara:strand:+ start:37 stop:456 length:420 start_codon:yes stop_codon:yes gene_type:complete